MKTKELSERQYQRRPLKLKSGKTYQFNQFLVIVWSKFKRQYLNKSHEMLMKIALES